MTPAFWDSSVNTQTPFLPTAPRNVLPLNLASLLRAREGSDDLLGSLTNTTASEHCSRIFRLVFCQWLTASAVNILIWNSWFKTVDAAAIKNEKSYLLLIWSFKSTCHLKARGHLRLHIWSREILVTTNGYSECIN